MVNPRFSGSLSKNVCAQKQVSEIWLFENLVTLEELLVLLKNQYSRHAVYKWVGQGMPHQKIRGKLWFPMNEVATWLQRSS